MGTITIDWSVSLGNILTILALMGAILGAYIKLMGRVDRLEDRFSAMDRTMETLALTVKSIGQLLTDTKVMDTRMSRLERDVDDLRHGEGFALPLLHARKAEPSK